MPVPKKELKLPLPKESILRVLEGKLHLPTRLLLEGDMEDVKKVALASISDWDWDAVVYTHPRVEDARYSLIVISYAIPLLADVGVLANPAISPLVKALSFLGAVGAGALMAVSSNIALHRLLEPRFRKRGEAELAESIRAFQEEIKEKVGDVEGLLALFNWWERVERWEKEGGKELDIGPIVDDYYATIQPYGFESPYRLCFISPHGEKMAFPFLITPMGIVILSYQVEGEGKVDEALLLLHTVRDITGKDVWMLYPGDNHYIARVGDPTLPPYQLWNSLGEEQPVLVKGKYWEDAQALSTFQAIYPLIEPPTLEPSVRENLVERVETLYRSRIRRLE